MEYSPQAKAAAGAEVQDKVEERKKGVEDAKYYRAFLDNLKTDVELTLKRALRENNNTQINLSTTDQTISQIMSGNPVKGVNPFDMTEEVKDVTKKTRQQFPSMGSSDLRFRAKILENMTPNIFNTHIEELKSSLLKGMTTPPSFKTSPEE